MTVAIEMVSDLVCPWCWLGLRRIRQAMAIAEEVEVRLLFRPFELDPTIPVGGVDSQAYNAQRWGSDVGRQRAREMRNALIKYGEEEDISFNFEQITIRPNSLNAHRLVRWAQGQDKGADCKEALFSAYFAQGRDIGDSHVLTDVAGRVGLDTAIIGDLLASDADIEAVQQEETTFRQMGVSGVPTYIADRRLAVQGAESAEKLARFLRAANADGPQQRGLAGHG